MRARAHTHPEEKRKCSNPSLGKASPYSPLSACCSPPAARVRGRPPLPPHPPPPPPPPAETGGFTSKPSGKTTATGFECPEPQPRLEVQSQDVNLFVWTEYIPQDIIECFQLVYGITVNRDEYSANEEMYAKISKGNTNYDLVQPTDFIVSLMIRQGLLEKLDNSKLTIMGNFDPNYLNFTFDPNNEYTLPYQAGTDSIVVNTAKVADVPKSWADLWKPAYA